MWRSSQRPSAAPSQPDFAPDVTAAAVLAAGAAHAAASLVAVNLLARDNEGDVRRRTTRGGDRGRGCRAARRALACRDDRRQRAGRSAGGTAGVVAEQRGGGGDRHRESPARAGRRRVGVRRRDGGQASRCASSTAASRRLTRSSAGSQGRCAISLGPDGEPVAEDDAEGDLCGHGTACAGVVRSIAPAAELYSVRVLGAGYKGSGRVLLAGLRWAIGQGYDVVNMSLSTTKRELGDLLHELADTAYFRRTVLVASAHNMPVESFPWRFSSVISVGQPRGGRPVRSTTPTPIRRSSSSRAASTWRSPGSAAARSAPPGNSFATPCISGIASLILSKHPGLTPFQLKTVLHLTSKNVRADDA